MPFWRKSEKSDARRDAKAHFLLVKGNTEKSSFTKKCCGEKKSVFRHHWPFSPIRLRDFYIFSTEFSSYTRHGGSSGGGYGLPCKFCEKCFKPEEYAHLRKKSDFQKSMKNGFETSNIYSFSRRVRIWIQNWTKTTPKPDFYQILKK